MTAGAVNWLELITGLYEGRRHGPGIASKPKYFPAASADEIAAAEADLNTTLPASIRTLLLQTNGVMDTMTVDGGPWFDSGWLLWTVAAVVERNRLYRAATGDGTHRRDFRKLVFFADAGCDGILFGFPQTDDRACAPRVVVWHPIRDAVTELAPALDDFLRGWLTGTLSV